MPHKTLGTHAAYRLNNAYKTKPKTESLRYHYFRSCGVHEHIFPFAIN